MWRLRVPTPSPPHLPRPLLLTSAHAPLPIPPSLTPLWARSFGVGTPQTEHSPSALNVIGCDTVEIFGVLSTAMHPDYYTKQHRGLPALITMSDNRRTRLVAPNVCNSAMIVNSSDAKMRVPEGGTGFKTAIIAWDTSSAGGTGLKSDDGTLRPRPQARWVQDVFVK